jgi:hypothetical protein
MVLQVNYFPEFDLICWAANQRNGSNARAGDCGRPVETVINNVAHRHYCFYCSQNIGAIHTNVGGVPLGQPLLPLLASGLIPGTNAVATNRAGVNGAAVNGLAVNGAGHNTSANNSASNPISGSNSAANNVTTNNGVANNRAADTAPASNTPTPVRRNAARNANRRSGPY